MIIASAIGCGGASLPGPHIGEGGSSGTGEGGSGAVVTSCTVVPGSGSGGSTATGGTGGWDGRACRCSRRPGENNSWMCPPGTGKVVTAEIGPAGGTVALDGTPQTNGVPLKLQIPINALTETVTIRVIELTTPPPQPYVDESPIYELQPTGLTFAIPALLTIPFENVQGIIPREIAGYLSTDDCASFTRIGDSYTNAGFIMASLSRLGQVFAGYPRGAADDIACAVDGGAI